MPVEVRRVVRIPRCAGETRFAADDQSLLSAN